MNTFEQTKSRMGSQRDCMMRLNQKGRDQ